MKLSAKPITNFANINQLDFSNQWGVRAGDSNVLYFQLIDLDQNNLRYLVGIGGSNQPAGVVVTFPSIDDAQIINLNATQDSNDKSIWYVLLGTSQVPGSGNVQFSITEGSNVRRFNVLNMISVEYINNGGC
jgi:hypothetical protein